MAVDPPAKRSLLSNRAWALALAGALALALLHGFISTCDHDEVEHLHASWLVSQGLLPYRDFVEHHHPTLYFLYAPLTRLFVDPMRLAGVGRLIDLLLIAASFAALAAWRGRPKGVAALWPALLLVGSWTYLRNSLEVRPDTWMNCFSVLGMIAWFGWLRAGRRWTALASGLCFGVAVAFLQKAVALWGLLILGSLALALCDRSRLRRVAEGLLLSTLASLLPLCALLLFIQHKGIFSEFIFWNYPFNQFFYLSQPQEYFSATPALLVAVAEDPLLWLLGGIGFAAAARAWLRSRAVEDEALKLAAVMVAGLLLAFFKNGFPFGHNLLLLLPPLGLLAADTFERLSPARWKRAAEVVLLLLLVKIAVLTFVYDENKGHEVMQQEILATTRPSDAVYIPPPYHPIFRRDSSYFWFDAAQNARVYANYCQQHACAKDRMAEERQSWAEHPPELVFLTKDEDAGSWPVDWEHNRDRYAPVAGFAGLMRLKAVQ